LIRANEGELLGPGRNYRGLDLDVLPNSVQLAGLRSRIGCIGMTGSVSRPGRRAVGRVCLYLLDHRVIAAALRVCLSLFMHPHILPLPCTYTRACG
jgi:hypothetical protein